MSNIVAIVGRPNVGKSTLFNRLTQSRDAIIHESSGVTRDRHYGVSNWNGIDFSVIDTGGYVTNSDDIFEEEIRKQAILAIDEADVIVFLVDVLSGITDLDDSIAAILRKSNKKIFLVVNKVDNNERLYDANVFYGLGLGDLYSVSSINGSGTGDLLDKIVEVLPNKTEAEDDDIPKFTIVGRPNVGKSSLINTFVGEQRNIVTPVSGTTRDSIHTRYNKFGHDFILVDTAGLRKKGKVSENIEFYSVMRSIRAIENSDVCMLLLDATRGIESQDVNVFHLIEKNRKGVVILVNKWDLVDKETNSTKLYEQKIREKIAPFSDVPIIFTSALTKQRVFKALETAIEVYENRKRKIQTSKLNEYMLAVIEANHPPAVKGKYVKIKYVTQLPTKSPQFAFYCNLPQYVKDAYKRYLENKLRNEYNFTGVPVQVYMRKK
ncbi:MAG: ribosome biogenesis GTPase Der [Bacteroidetes bacterium 4572_117]|nr:MAG: ribosome biogenesis GTPase Der [Bacteroidetes bacterium 4572_117]